MDWKSASSYYESRLTDALAVSRYAISLATLPQAEVPSTLKEILIQEAEPARRQLQRLKKREFRIAVVGLEKAGKSTFINAWLECDLLPAKGARCTFTTTQIYSVVSDTEQRLEVQAKTDEQFFQLLENLKQANATEDLRIIQQYEDTLSQVRQEGSLTIPFTRLEDIKEHLRKYVADEHYAHAVQEARLYTSKLAQAEGIVFYDVPGLDSGLAMHVEEARKMLSDCDAVILVQRFTNLRERELEIIQFTELGDVNVAVADKLFVFLSRIDSFASPEALKQHIREASQDWLLRAKLPTNRIVSGSAGAYLVLNGLAEKQTELEVGDPISLKNRFELLGFSTDSHESLNEATGIPEIKQKVFDYINFERVNVLKRRCDAIITKIIETSEKIAALVKEKYPENPEDAQRVQEERQRILFTEWWHKKWEQVKADLQTYFNTSVVSRDANSSVPSPSSIQKFKQRYYELVESEMNALIERAQQKKEVIFAANSNPVFDRVNANFRWREALYIDVSKALASIASQLAQELQDEATSLIDYMTSLLWGSSLVHDRLIGSSGNLFAFKLENSLSVLFLRFARPVAEAIIRGPVNSDTRNEVVKNLGVDVEIVDNYYNGKEPAFQVLRRYVRYGSKLLFDSGLRREVLGVSQPTTLEDFQPLACEPQSPEEVVTFEVLCDIKAFKEFLLSAIFDAAGFESYCIQELKGLVDQFRDMEGTWAGVALNEWLQGNPALLSEVPNSLKSLEINLEVSERLRQLVSSLQSFRLNAELSV
ncbi:dynamin family protein [Thermosynechococcus sp. FA-CM-4201]